MEEELFINWFNKGYSLSEQKPELAKSIQDSLNLKEDVRARGFVAGHEQFIAEKEKHQDKGKFTRNYTMPKSADNKLPRKEKTKGRSKD